jgi:hypothetical protein
MPRRPAVAVVALLCLIAVWSPRTAGSPQLTISLGDALTYYEFGESDAVIRALVAARGSDAFALVPFFEKEADAWIRADGPTEI